MSMAVRLLSPSTFNFPRGKALGEWLEQGILSSAHAVRDETSLAL